VRLSNFGLALCVPKRLPAAAAMMGVYPAYVTPKILSTKTDVFSFGILLLEGRKAIDLQTVW
jgi:hypothetical protein